MAYFLKQALQDFFPAHGGVPGIADAGLDEFVERYRAEVALTMRAGIAVSVLVYTVGPLFTVGRPVLAPWLPAALRDEHAQRMASSRIYLVRQAMFLLKTIGGLCWGAHPGVRAALGIPAYGPDPGTFRT